MVLVKDEPSGRVYGVDGVFRGIFAFSETREALWSWQEEWMNRLRRAGVAIARGADGRIPAGKDWIADAVAIGGGQFLVAMTPERLDEAPRELWRLNHEGTVVDRYVFDRTWIGWYAASFQRIYTIGVRDASVYEYRAGEQ